MTTHLGTVVPTTELAAVHSAAADLLAEREVLVCVHADSATPATVELEGRRRPALMLCRNHPGAGLMCSACLAEHQVRTGENAAWRCERCSAPLPTRADVVALAGHHLPFVRTLNPVTGRGLLTHACVGLIPRPGPCPCGGES